MRSAMAVTMFDLTRFRRQATTRTDEFVRDDAVLDGHSRGSDESLASYLDGLRDLADTSATPNAALRDVLARGLGSDRLADPAVAHARPRSLRRLAAKLAGLSLLAQIGVGAAAASAVALGAASRDALPGPAQDVVAGWVERVTPFDLPDSADFGRRVSQDATDDTPGVEGPSIADERTSTTPATTDHGSQGNGVSPQPPHRPDRPAGPDKEHGDRPRVQPLTPYQLWRPQTPASASEHPSQGDHERPASPAASDPSNRPSTPPSEPSER